LWPPIHRVGAFAGFDLDIVARDVHPLGFGKAGDGGTLDFQAKP